MLPTPSAARFKDTAPLKTLAKASAACSAQSIAYGACMGKKYQEVSKDMCAEEFRAFKECVQKNFGRKW